MDRKTTEELNELSKKVFGASSRWRKLVENGVQQPMERDKEVMVPTRDGRNVEMKTFTEKKTVLKRYTVDEIRDLMKRLASPTPEVATNEQS